MLNVGSALQKIEHHNEKENEPGLYEANQFDCLILIDLYIIL